MATTTDAVLELAQDAQNLLFREARTANNFGTDPVADTHLRAIYDLVQWAPTAKHSASAGHRSAAEKPGSD
jgi:3-hydroxypropanoate dehydrogenase